MLIGGSGLGTVFCCFLQPLHDLLATESDCAGNDGGGKLFWCIKKKTCSCCFLVAIKFFSHFIGKCQCKHAVRFEMKSREENYGCNRPIRTKHNAWFALVNKYLRGKIRRTSLKLTEIWPISDPFLKQKYHCITVHYRTAYVSEKNRLGQTVQTGQQTLGHLELFLDYVQWHWVETYTGYCSKMSRCLH